MLYGTIRDRVSFGSFDPVALREATFRVIERTQDDPATQVVAIAMAFTTITQSLQLDPRDLLQQCEARLADVDGPMVGTYKAIREYAANELGRR